MDTLIQIYDFVFHLERHIETIKTLSPWIIYGFFILIIFAETGFVVTPFLPGDSFLFVVGTIAALGIVDINLILLCLTIAGILGNIINYHIGRYIGPRAFQFQDRKFFNKKMLIAAHEFYLKHGGKTIIISRFMPFLRTFAPFVAGIGEMPYFRFLVFTIIGAVLWIFSFTLAGYFFGQIPLIKENFSEVVIIIVLVTTLPVFIAAYKNWQKNKSVN